jgi:hypothetical protein
MMTFAAERLTTEPPIVRDVLMGLIADLGRWLIDHEQELLVGLAADLGLVDAEAETAGEMPAIAEPSPLPAGMIRAIVRGGKLDGVMALVEDGQEHVSIEGVRHWRINEADGNRWVFIPDGAGIPPGKRWFMPPYNVPPPPGV